MRIFTTTSKANVQPTVSNRSSVVNAIDSVIKNRKQFGTVMTSLFLILISSIGNNVLAASRNVPTAAAAPSGSNTFCIGATSVGLILIL